LDQHGAELLRKAMSIEPNNADVQHSLGLLLVRQRDYPGALDLLRRASEFAPDNARYAYVYAIALNSTGASGQAMAVLGEAHRRHPTDREVNRIAPTIVLLKPIFSRFWGYALPPSRRRNTHRP
jgi:Flp pilus assembly protein TadD